MTTAHTVYDTKTGREFRIIGDKLGTASTSDQGRSRWSELEIWKTESGQYVIVKAGRSDLVHATRECAGSYAEELTGDDLRQRLTEAYVPCYKCCTSETFARLREQNRSPLGVDKTTPCLYSENDLVSVIVAADAADAVKAVHTRGRNGVSHLTNMALDALREACLRDEVLRSAFEVVVIS